MIETGYRLRSFFSSIALSIALAATGSAGVISQVGDNSDLWDSASWAGIAPESTAFTSGSVTSASGVSVTVTPPANGSAYQLTSGGGFPVGDNLLYNGALYTGYYGDLTLGFGQSVSGAGLFVLDDYYDTTDTVTLSAYDSSDALLGAVTTPYNGNNTPVFIGLLDTTPEIASITIGTGEGDFLVDTLYLADSAPEPASLALCGLGLLGLAGVRRLRRS